MKRDELRAIFIKDQNDEYTIFGGFHIWESYSNNEISKLNGIVELEDGSIIRVDPENIKFRNLPFGANLFEEGL